MIPPVDGHRFVGRTLELGVLMETLVRVESGQARTVLLGGEAGIGKTSLIQEFTRQAEVRGDQVLLGSCRDLGAVPYSPIVDVLRTLVSRIGRSEVRDLAGSDADSLSFLLPALAPHKDAATAGGISQGRIFEAVLRLLDQLGVERPIVLVVEDLHWADRSTLDLLGFLVGALSIERILIVVTYRTTDLRPGHPFWLALPELRRRSTAASLELDCFAGHDFEELVTAITGTLPEPSIVARLHDRSDGNPFFVEEILAGDPVNSDAMPPTVTHHLLVRLAELDHISRDVINTASVVGRGVSHQVISAACQLPPAVLDAALRDCVTRHLLAVDHNGHGYVFRHSLTQEAVYGDLLPGQRIRLHGLVAATLEQTEREGGGDGAAELAYHWWEADRPVEALRYCVQAAKHASRVFGFAEAARFYEQAMTLWGRVPDPERVGEISYEALLTKAADARRWTGDVTQAVRLVEQAVALVDSDGQRERERLAGLLDRQGRYLWEMGDSAGSLNAYERAWKLLDGQVPTADHAWVLAGYATALMQAGRHTQAIPHCRRALAMADASGGAAAKGRALNTLGVCLALTGEPSDGISALRQAADIAGRSGELEDIDRAYANLTYVLESCGRLEEALSVAREGARRTAELGVELTGGGVLLANTASVLVLLGRWDEAATVAREALARRLPAAFTQYLQLVAAEADIARGEFDRAVEQLDVVRVSSSGRDEPQVTGTLLALDAELAIWRHDPAAACDFVDAGLAALASTEEHVLELRLCAIGLRAAADARGTLLMARRPEGADVTRIAARLSNHADHIRNTAKPAPSPEMAALSLLCKLEYARTLSGADSADWVRLATEWKSSDRPYPAAYALWRSAECDLELRESRSAAAALQQAYQLVRKLNAAPLRHEIELLARRGRITLEEVAHHQTQPADPYGLTAREREVLQLLTQGRTNRQIATALYISEKTASVHVSNILGKLGVANRGEAAAFAHRAISP